jgi:hypothetical protein
MHSFEVLGNGCGKDLLREVITPAALCGIDMDVEYWDKKFKGEELSCQR